MLAVIETHPIQYHAPVYRALQADFGVPVTAIYGSNFSVAGYHDVEFKTTFSWDTDLLSGYASDFLSRVEQGGAKSADAASTAGLRERLHAINPDAILVTGYSPAFYRSAWFDAWRTRKPLLFRAETSDDAETRRWLKAHARRLALRVAYRSCASLLFVGERSRRHFEACGVPAARLRFSPYCVDTAPFRATEADRARMRAPSRADLQIADDAFVIVFAGKLSHRKGVDVLLEAVKLMPASLRQQVTLLFLGDGDMRQRLTEQAGLEPRVDCRFVGFQNQSQLSRYYHAADLLALPSRHSETWGLVVNEALHHGLPVVVSDRVGCAPDLVVAGTTGVVTELSAERLAHSLTEARRLRGLDVRHACRAHVEKYSVGAAARGIADAYHALVATRADAA
ncbi:MAG TPA: glycosyltransferase family 4 protein [Vicinamibacterales bacterium]|nr:glycosyltransferase family 4 protein [Vicinamibacterales bacterium]